MNTKNLNHKLQTFAAAIVISTACTSRMSATQDDAISNAAEIGAMLQSSGDWVVRGFDVGFLREGASKVLQTTLYKGVTYKIIAAGCDDAADVDIQVYDENWHLVDGDDDSSRVAIADVVPAWTGTFHIKVTMHSCTFVAAHWSVQLAYAQ